MTDTFKVATCIAGSNQTILGLLKHYNKYDLDAATIELLLQEFSRLNPQAHPPKLGQKLQIPILSTDK